jgi:hypothetical protein
VEDSLDILTSFCESCLPAHTKIVPITVNHAWGGKQAIYSQSTELFEQSKVGCRRLLLAESRLLIIKTTPQSGW